MLSEHLPKAYTTFLPGTDVDVSSPVGAVDGELVGLVLGSVPSSGTVVVGRLESLLELLHVGVAIALALDSVLTSLSSCCQTHHVLDGVHE